jgi:hypothetical protein
MTTPASLQADIDKGLPDLVEGRVEDFDFDQIIARALANNRL